MVIIEGTFLVVGIPIYDRDKVDHKYKGKYQISAKVKFLEDMKEGQLYCFSANQEDFTDGTPKYIIGRAILETEMDAIEIKKGHFRKIKQEKKTVEKILNEKARLWIIGYGSC